MTLSRNMQVNLRFFASMVPEKEIPLARWNLSIHVEHTQYTVYNIYIYIYMSFLNHIYIYMIILSHMRAFFLLFLFLYQTFGCFGGCAPNWLVFGFSGLEAPTSRGSYPLQWSQLHQQYKVRPGNDCRWDLNMLHAACIFLYCLDFMRKNGILFECSSVCSPSLCLPLFVQPAEVSINYSIDTYIHIYI